MRGYIHLAVEIKKEVIYLILETENYFTEQKLVHILKV